VRREIGTVSRIVVIECSRIGGPVWKTAGNDTVSCRSAHSFCFWPLESIQAGAGYVQVPTGSLGHRRGTTGLGAGEHLPD
jgi:hypothetical protein